MPSNFAAVDLLAKPSLARDEARIHSVRSVIATPASLEGFGRVVTEFASAQVTIVTWPQQGWRPIQSGTALQVASLRIVLSWNGAARSSSRSIAPWAAAT